MSASRVSSCAILALALAGCGPSAVGVCASNADCPSGDVCNLQSECVTVQAPTAPDAGLPPPPDGAGTECVEQTIALPHQPPAVHLVLDQSGTMNRDFDGTTRFTAMRDALVGNDGLIADLDDQVLFGITLYTSHEGGATCPILQSTARQTGSRDAIAAILDDNRPDADNPLAETLERILSDFTVAPPPAGASRLVVVATDGVADSCVDSDDGSGADGSLAGATALAAAGIELRMISIANGVEAGYLQQMANAGAGLGGSERVSATFFTATDKRTMLEAFQRSVRGVRCRVDGSGIPAAQRDGAALALDGRALATGDWDALATGEIELLGSACDAFLAATAPAVTATVPCP